ncbi:MAG TPA: ATP-binding cassette domain-containing protein [Candidatus Dormibacteraeota bacterium]|nr:ATP-binding cassette domain-containing protein [Candidatus Dormibacteraeota bacterium]
MAGPWQPLVDRIYGPRRPGALADAVGDARRWARGDRALALGGAALVLAAAVLIVGDVRTVARAGAGVYTIVALYGLWLVVVQTGQPSLGHAAFLGIGAYATAYLRLSLGLDGLTSLAISAIACGGVGWLLGRGTSRLKPAFVALATWAFGWLAILLVTAFPAQSGGGGGIALRAPLEVRLDALGLDLRFNDAGHLVAGVAILVAAMLLLRSAQRSAIGRGWASVRQHPGMAAAIGYDVAAIRRRALAWGGAVAGLAGSLAAQASGVVDPAAYSPLVSLQLFAAVLIGVPAGFLGPVVGYTITVLLPQLLIGATGAPSDSRLQGIVVAVLTIVALTVSLSWRRSPLPAAANAEPEQAATGTGDARAASRPPAAGVPALEVRGVDRAFGGVQALGDVSLSVAAGEVHALIGPNGSGKSTLLRCIAGTIAPDRGEVLVGGRSIAGLDAPARVAAGVARTFQRPVAFGQTSPQEQVLAAVRRGPGGWGWLRAVAKTPSYRVSERQDRGTALATLRRLDLAAGAGGDVAGLNSGELRRLQVAIALASRPSVLLLDEPAAGMDVAERADFARTLRSLAEEGLAVLVVDHDLGFVREVADRATVLVGGAVLATGKTSEVVRDSSVRRAYLGREG